MNPFFYKLKSSFINNRFILFAFLSFQFTFLSGQTTIETIDIPNGTNVNGGTLVGELLYANNFLYAYSPDGVSIYNSSNDLVKKIEYDPGMLGKFNPLFSYEELHPVERNLMLYNNEPGNEYVYILTPQMKFLVIDANDFDNYYYVSLPVKVDKYYTGTCNTIETTLDALFQSQNGMSIMKYDNRTGQQYLYMLVKGKQIDDDTPNCTGDFHSKRTLFCVYKLDYNISPSQPDHFSLIDYQSHGYWDYSISNATIEYGDQIINFLFNETNNYVYVVRLGEVATANTNPTAFLDIYTISSTGFSFVKRHKMKKFGGTLFHKMGKLLFINDPISSIEKLLVFPYRFTKATMPQYKWYAIDGDNPALIDSIVGPSTRILDAIYLEGPDDLVLSYSPGDDVNPSFYVENEPSNLAVFHLDTNNNFTATSIDIFNNDNSQVTSLIDKNAPFALTKLEGSFSNGIKALICKKDGVAKLSGTIVSNAMEYDYSEHLTNASSENNYYNKGSVKDPANAYVLNSVANGFEIYSGGAIVQNRRTAYPVHHIVANSDGSRKFCFNKLNASDLGLYSIGNDNDPASHLNKNQGLDAPIGDCIYNPYQDHFLISKCEEGSADILIFNTDNSYGGTISIPNTEFVKEMNITADGKFFVCSKMRRGSYPKMHELNASDYSDSIITHTIGGIQLFTGDYLYYSAQFCYSENEMAMYVSLSIQDLEFSPYNLERSSIYDQMPPNNPIPGGKLLRIKEETVESYPGLQLPGKIICPDNEFNDPASPYYGKLYVIGNQFYEYAYMDPPPNGIVSTSDELFVDISYCPVTDMLYALKNEAGSCPQHRITQIYKIFYSDDTLVFSPLANLEKGGQAAGMFYNKYDGKMYVYQKIDADKQGGSEVKLLSFVPSENPGWEPEISLGITSYFPDYDHTDDVYDFFFYNIITPYIDPYSNFIYLPNGGHSCISKVSFEADEVVLLPEGEWNWLSFPRVVMPTSGNPIVHNVLYGNGDRIDPMYELDSKIVSIPVGGSDLLYNDYINYFWTERTIFGFDEIDRRLGYKLHLKYNDPQDDKKLFLEGNLINPMDASVDLVGENKENWIGYYLHTTQSPFDAIADEIETEISIIKAQNWVCYNENPLNENVLWRCACNKGKIELKYADMVIMKTNDYQNGLDDFHWTYYGNTSDNLDRPATENYQFQEMADFTPIFIELDTSQNPFEIGAFIEDSCIGGTTVFPDDSLVLVSAYTEGLSGEIYFEQYYGGLKSALPPLTNYYVKNNKTKRRERRMIHSNEKQNYFLVSFQPIDNDNENTLENDNLWLKCQPNPVNSNTRLIYSIPEDAYISIIVYDIFGNIQIILKEGNISEGVYEMDISADMISGVYIIVLECNNCKVQTKIVKMN